MIDYTKDVLIFENFSQGHPIEAFFSVIAISTFILLGFIAKKIYGDKIDEKTLILISVYFLQPILTFWGLTRAPINFDLIAAPMIYLVIVLFTMFVLLIFAKTFFSDPKQQSIFIAASLIGNTGNLGIPLGIAVFGEASIAYTSIINIANVFFIYTLGIFFYAKSHYSAKESIVSIAKIPIIWVGIGALYFNYLEFFIPKPLEQAMQMGAYATIVLQLFIFGVYLSALQLKTINYKLSIYTSIAKLLLLPSIGFIIISFTDLAPMVKAILFLQLMLPLAVNNVNIAALYNCKPILVAGAVFISSILFLIFLYGDLWIIARSF